MAAPGAAARYDPGYLPAQVPGNRTEARPRLSVVTPSFNYARFLPETLNSVASLRTPHEHLVIDGGSTDGTVELLEARRDPSLLWVSEPDRGQTHAVNKGFERARGELIAWLNADDAYIPAHVDRALEVFDTDPRTDAIFGFTDIIDENGAFQKQYKCGPFNWRRYLYFGDYLPTVTVIFRRSLLAKAPRLNERYADTADYDFYLRLLRGAKVRRIRQSLVRFRYHPVSKTASNPDLQRREGMEIRLTYARNELERRFMQSAGWLMEKRSTLLSPWPELPHER